MSVVVHCCACMPEEKDVESDTPLSVLLDIINEVSARQSKRLGKRADAVAQHVFRVHGETVTRMSILESALEIGLAALEQTENETFVISVPVVDQKKVKRGKNIRRTKGKRS